MNNEDKIIKLLEKMQGDINGMKEDMGLVRTQLKEHGGILSALGKASETHKAENDNLTLQVAKLSQETKAEFKELNIKIDNISKDLSVVEVVTGKNMTDIAHLKAAK